jgi:hypothetical protein
MFMAVPFQWLIMVQQQPPPPQLLLLLLMRLRLRLLLLLLLLRPLRLRGSNLSTLAGWRAWMYRKPTKLKSGCKRSRSICDIFYFCTETENSLLCFRRGWASGKVTRHSVSSCHAQQQLARTYDSGDEESGSFAVGCDDGLSRLVSHVGVRVPEVKMV